MLGSAVRQAVCRRAVPALPRAVVAAPAVRTAAAPLHTTARTPAQYRRFGERTAGASSTASLAQLASRFGGRGSPNGGGRLGARAPLIIVVVLGAGGVYYVAHLERVPATGRLRFIDVSPAQERRMGDEAYAQMLQEYRSRIEPAGSAQTRRVRAVAGRLISALEGEITTRGIEWDVHVVSDNEKNAFVLPNGKIFVNSGILGICKDDDGLATVLGHEISHTIARHSAEKASGIKVLFAFALVAELFGVDLGFARLAANLLLSLPNSRSMEREADHMGLELMSKACFDPREAPHLWERMEASQGGNGRGDFIKGLVSTHPVNSARIKSIKEWLPDALQHRASVGCPEPSTVSGFRSAVSGAGERFFAEPRFVHR